MTRGFEVLNEREWLETRTNYITKTEEEGQAIIELTEEWMAKMEEGLKKNKNFREVMESSVQEADIQELNTDMFGEVLFLISTMWVKGDEFSSILTHIEKRLLVETILAKVQVMQEAAVEGE